ncbi:sugar glycosyltransferase [Atlantibacter hermannii]|uniref:sugar glycosyltransferase n=1 Tax=Atlantibacter hermannii TaxID=565 RepID=UPI0022B7A355|nr:sugar glycosyltransferase [Atlantibacter hermannii]MCZ7835349.1 sugar glycosyltransferase [Atlantibacter hermannii]
MGSLFKQIYRYTRPRAFRHNENLWPWAKITRAQTGEIRSLKYKGIAVPLAGLSDLKNRYQGDVLLTATGPSTKKMDFSVVPETMPVMGVNGAYVLQGQVRYSLYIVVDMEFFDSKPETITAVISNPDIVFFTTLHGVAKIYDRHPQNEILCQIALIEDACCRIYQGKITDDTKWQTFKDNDTVSFDEKNSNICFTTDIRNGIFDAGTVVYWALQVLYFLGFNRILISGLDMNNFHQPRFYESEHTQLPSYLENKVENIVFPAFSLASRVLEQHGVYVFNLSQESAVPELIFKKVKLHVLFKE